MFSYPVTKGIHPSTPEVSETQLKQARILENLIGEVGFNRHKKLIRAHPNLVLEVADEFTRAFLFDIVEDSYRFVAGGESQTTFEMQGINIEIGIRNACDQLAEITGFNFLYSNNDDLFCGQSNGKKTHTTTISLSNNQPLKVVVINVHPKSSTFDIQKLIGPYHGQIIGEAAIEDEGSLFEGLDMVARLKPDLVWVAGHLDNEKNNLDKKIKKMSHLVGLSIPQAQRPVFLYGSKNSITKEIQRTTHREIPNFKEESIREPSDVEQKDLLKDKFVDIALSIQKKNIPGLAHVTHPIKKDVVLGCEAFGRIIQYLDLSTGMEKGVLGIDIGSSKTLAAAAQSGEIKMELFPEVGTGRGISNFLNNTSLAEITKWLPYDVEESYVDEYLLNKTL